MPRSNMTSQRTATKRNAQAEQVSHYTLEKFAKALLRNKQITQYSIATQEQFNSPITRDRWDHTLRLQLPGGEIFEIWGQTTCYKGHVGGETESNKTYEVRETLTETLCLKATKPTDVAFGTVHITFGDSDYAYSWFKPMKEKTFDLSLYFDDPEDVFVLIDCAIGSLTTESQINTKLDAEMANSTKLGRILTRNQETLEKWHSEGNFKLSAMGLAQAALIRTGIPAETELKKLMTHARGDNIKKKAVDVILNSSQRSSDILIQEIVADLLTKKPFLANANRQIIEWDDYVAKISSVWQQDASELENLVSLWNVLDQSTRESTRRILLRVHSEETTDYVQDLGIEGITEHNLYGGTHSAAQAAKVANVISRNLKENMIEASELIPLISKNGRGILRNQIYFEAKNGTSNTSSFDFIQKTLINAGFKIVSSTEAGLKLIGFHSEITDGDVRPYTNFKVVQDNDGKILCILKGKFFSVAEFDRRCKEEGFVGLSLQYQWNSHEFTPRFPIPLVMCIDMEPDFTPPEFAVRKLLAMGWTVAFGPNHLIQILKNE